MPVKLVNSVIYFPKKSQKWRRENLDIRRVKQETVKLALHFPRRDVPTSYFADGDVRASSACLR